MSENPPVKAEFNVGVYDDGSGPVVRVRIDATSSLCAECIWIDGGEHSDRWVAFDWRFADELIAALYRAKNMLAARSTQGDQP